MLGLIHQNTGGIMLIELLYVIALLGITVTGMILSLTFILLFMEDTMYSFAKAMDRAFDWAMDKIMGCESEGW